MLSYVFVFVALLDQINSLARTRKDCISKLNPLVLDLEVQTWTNKLGTHGLKPVLSLRLE